MAAACSACQASTSGFSNLCDLCQQIHALKQDVNMLGLEDDLSLLRRDEAVFHCVGDPYRGIETDNPRSAFKRMCRAHEWLDDFGRGRSTLECHQARRKRGRYGSPPPCERAPSSKIR